jgi:hypothetical protein
MPPLLPLSLRHACIKNLCKQWAQSLSQKNIYIYIKLYRDAHGSNSETSIVAGLLRPTGRRISATRTHQYQTLA